MSMLAAYLSDDLAFDSAMKQCISDEFPAWDVCHSAEFAGRVKAVQDSAHDAADRDFLCRAYQRGLFERAMHARVQGQAIAYRELIAGGASEDDALAGAELESDDCTDLEATMDAALPILLVELAAYEAEILQAEVLNRAVDDDAVSLEEWEAMDAAADAQIAASRAQISAMIEGA